MKYFHVAVNLVIVFFFLSLSAEVFHGLFGSFENINFLSFFEIIGVLFLFLFLYFFVRKIVNCRKLPSIYAAWALIFIIFSFLGVFQIGVATQNIISMILMFLFCYGIFRKINNE